ncbi:hypothetical protein KIM372_09420 [Bombiscardovia nodaiensis]|uniref:Permease n=1 Tax=Bombiscardovia nodaiensis TaxID=2932181 RepID=A0ABN6SDP8_9BIFI|nr:hypothetical protein KIM372_09420 [Bombiscardovia nodaiensis]
MTVLVWVVLYHDSVARLFTLAGMGTSSRVLMCIASLAWLPNMMLWALSWVCGGGFYVGDLASFTLWSGHAQALPSLPMFGLFPDPVANASMRVVLLLIPAVLAGVLALTALCKRQAFGLLSALREQGLARLDLKLVRVFLDSLIGLAASVALSLVALLLALLCSNGALGQHRLAHLGVNLSESMGVFVRGMCMGTFVPWFAALCIAALILTYNLTQAAVSRRAELVSTMPSQEADADHSPGSSSS